MYLLWSSLQNSYHAAESLGHLTPAQIQALLQNIEIQGRLLEFAPGIIIALAALIVTLLMLTIDSMHVMVMVFRERQTLRPISVVVVLAIYTVLSLVASIGIDALATVTNDVLLTPPTDFDGRYAWVRLLAEGCLVPVMCALVGVAIRRRVGIRYHTIRGATV